jgi:hypothetical protein
MSFDNNLLIEKRRRICNRMGYRFKDVVFSLVKQIVQQEIIKSDIMKAGFVLSCDNKTIVRYLDYDNNQFS